MENLNYNELQSKLVENKKEIDSINKLIDELVSRKQQLLETQNLLKAQQQTLREAKLHEKNWDSLEFEWSHDVQITLKDVFKLNKFRPFQLAAINAIMSSKDCLLLMPTGGGKSLCYQLPAILLKGITLVVSPLVSLMEDQMFALSKIGIHAAMFSSSLSFKESKSIMQLMVDKQTSLKLVYVTPEKMAKSKTFMTYLQKAYECGTFKLLAIDEVHCCSQWGHDFRTDYKILGIMKRQFPRVPLIGLTATATPDVLKDVKKFLALEECLTFRAPFNRPNLKYSVHAEEVTSEKSKFDILLALIKKFKGLSGIVYCFSVKESEQVANDLAKNKVRAKSYHAQMESHERSETHKEWIDNEIDVVVATVAFGMGIDKPDVRFVIHYTIPKSMESYYQESGRAGRDDKAAECILLYHFADIFRLSTMLHIDRNALEKLYEVVDYCLNLKSCRRALMVHHFNESYKPEMCKNMCDHCCESKEFQEKEMTKDCLYIFEIIKYCKSLKEKITAHKLVSLCVRSGPAKLRPPADCIKKLGIRIRPQIVYERIIALLLLKKYLSQSFSFTTYTTISYIDFGEAYEYICFNISDFKFIIPVPSKKRNSIDSPNSNNSLSSKKRTLISESSKLEEKDKCSPSKKFVIEKKNHVDTKPSYSNNKYYAENINDIDIVTLDDG